jgi:hypothetical protein
MTRVQRRPKQKRKINKMKNQNIVVITIVSVLAFALAPVTKARIPEGGPDPASPALSANDAAVITVHSTDNVTRGQTGSFVLARALGKASDEDMKPALMFGGTYVNFKVSGTAIAGVDYVLLVSPAYIGRSGYGVILVKTLPDRRGSAFRQALSVTVTLEPGAGYAIGAARSATMWIKPAFQSSNQSSD